MLLERGPPSLERAPYVPTAVPYGDARSLTAALERRDSEVVAVGGFLAGGVGLTLRWCLRMRKKRSA